MRISDTELKKVINRPSITIVDAIVEAGQEHQRQQDQELVETVSVEVLKMGDRDAMIEELKLQIASGSYNPSGEEIVDAMIRRAVADDVK